MIVSLCLLYLSVGQLLAWIFGEKGRTRATGYAGHSPLATLPPRLGTTGQITVAAAPVAAAPVAELTGEAEVEAKPKRRTRKKATAEG